jgi:hypothetical protein
MCPKTQIERVIMERTHYASAIGSLIYMMIYARPNVSYTLSIISRYQSNSSEGH